MFAMSAISASLGPGLLALALWLVLPLIPPDRQPWRMGMFALVIVLAWRYMAWRFIETIPELDFSVDAIVAWGFALLEAGTVVSTTIAFFILSRTRDRKAEATSHLGWWGSARAPQVDVLIATYNEEAAILERTIVGAMASPYPHFRVWVLDDGRRPWLADMCESLGAHYATRSDNNHAKAGNINAALPRLRALPQPPDFIAVLDADFVPHLDFIPRMLSLFHDPEVGLVQSPQHFFNPDPIQHNLGIENAYPDEQRFFFDHIQPARDAWSISFCCGTSSMMRWRGLESIGGFPTGSVTEDFLITLRLREEGWKTVYLNEALTEGLAPEGLGEYVTQRGRWCLGLIQIVRGDMGPFARNRLRLIDRLGLVDAFLYWAMTYPFRLACLLIPLLYWYFGITAVNAPVPGVLSYFGPYYIASIATLNWISGGLLLPILNDVSQVLGATEITKAVAIGLVKPKGHKFKVTTKGGDRNKMVIQWPLIRPLAAVFALTSIGIFFSSATDIVFDRDAGDGKWVVLFWTIYNLIVLAVTISVCVELPRANTVPQIAPERVVVHHGETTQSGWIMRLTAEDAWVRGGPSVQSGDTAILDIADIGQVVGVVMRTEPSGFAVALALDAGQRTRMTSKLHTRSGRHGTLSISPTRLVSGLIRRFTRD